MNNDIKNDLLKVNVRLLVFFVADDGKPCVSLKSSAIGFSPV